MSRPIWKGHISFGLVNVPITLYSGEKRTDLQFRMIDSRNQARVRYERVNEQTGEEVPWDEIVRGYEYDGDNYVLLSAEDFKKASPEATQSVEIEAFVERAEIDVRYYEKPYYLVPAKKGEKGYVLLREALRDAGKVGVARVVIHTREHLAALFPLGDALVMNLLRFDQELRKAKEFDIPEGTAKDYGITKKELDMASNLLDSMTESWSAENYHDGYRDRLLEYIESKQAKGDVAEKEDTDEDEAPAGEIIDFMDLLKKSVAKEKKGGKSSTKKRRKSTTKRKTKSAAKKSTAKRKRKASTKKKAANE